MKQRPALPLRGRVAREPGSADDEAHAREHIRARLAAVPAEVHALADELRSLISDCVLRAGGEGDPHEATEQLKKMRRAYYSVRREDDLSVSAVVAHLYTMRQVFETVASDGTPLPAETQVRLVRDDKRVGRLVTEWSDAELLEVLRAPNFGKTTARVLKAKGISMTVNNVQRLAQRRHVASIDKD